MRIGAIVFISIVLLIGCVHLDINRNLNALNRVELGDDLAAVIDTVGTPDIRTDINDRRFVIYYQTQAGKNANEPITPDLCTPIAFEDGEVVAIGDDLAETWMREEEDRLRRAEDAERKRREAQRAADAKQEAEAARQRKIAALEKEVKPIPGHKAALNLKLYRQLLELDPGNARYQKKVAFYEDRLARQQKASKARADRAAKLKQRQAWDQAREERNKGLRQYTGNGIAEMAVHDMGPGSLYVWVKNVSTQIITTHPDHFTLLDNSGKPVRCEISSSLDSVLEPGSISHGKIQYSDAVLPSELVFRNRESGKISKSFK